jgi:hypothetical protein
MKEELEGLSDPARQLLRHTVATVAYRAGKALRAAPEFAAFTAGASTRTPLQILAHMGDLFDWALMLARGTPAFRTSEPLPWPREVERFFAALRAFDDFLASDARLAEPATRLFQGPIADALTHTGQLSLLRRLANAPLRGENYFVADIAAGRVGPEQPPPRREFE